MFPNNDVNWGDCWNQWHITGLYNLNSMHITAAHCPKLHNCVFAISKLAALQTMMSGSFKWIKTLLGKNYAIGSHPHIVRHQVRLSVTTHRHSLQIPSLKKWTKMELWYYDSLWKWKMKWKNDWKNDMWSVAQWKRKSYWAQMYKKRAKKKERKKKEEERRKFVKLGKLSIRLMCESERSLFR